MNPILLQMRTLRSEGLRDLSGSHRVIEQILKFQDVDLPLLNDAIWEQFSI